MGDLSFAKQFLNSLDSRINKYDSNYVFDPKKFPLRTPYTLSKLSHPPHPLPPRSTSLPSPPPGSQTAEPTVTITLKSSRNPNMSITLSAISPSTTTIQSLKEQVQTHLGGPSAVDIHKIKILLNKKPIPSTKKTVQDALDSLPPQEKSDINKILELGIFVMGGAKDPPEEQVKIENEKHLQNQQNPSTTEKIDTAGVVDTSNEKSIPMEGVEKVLSPSGEPIGKAALETSEFWDDLEGFLRQRLRDTEEAERMKMVFTKAWIDSKRIS